MRFGSALLDVMEIVIYRANLFYRCFFRLPLEFRIFERLSVSTFFSLNEIFNLPIKHRNIQNINI